MCRSPKSGALDEHRRSILGMAMVSNDSPLRRRRAEQAGRFRPDGAAAWIWSIIRLSCCEEARHVALAESAVAIESRLRSRTEPIDYVPKNRTLGSTIRQELAMIILRELNDPRLIGLPSITRVKVSRRPVDRRCVRHDHGHARPADRRPECPASTRPG